MYRTLRILKGNEDYATFFKEEAAIKSKLEKAKQLKALKRNRAFFLFITFVLMIVSLIMA